MDVFDLPAVVDLLRLALAEDLGAGDLTTRLTVPAGTAARAAIRAKQAAVIAGIPIVRKICDLVGGEVEVKERIGDGSRVAADDVLAELSGPAPTLLAIERVTLN